MAMRRLGAAGNVARRKSLDVRMDDLERRLVETLSAQSAIRTRQIADLRGEILKAFAARGAVSAGSVLPAKGKNGGMGGGKGSSSSAEAPVASRVEEARLSQIITEALDSVMAARSGTGMMTAAAGVAGAESTEMKVRMTLFGAG